MPKVRPDRHRKPHRVQLRSPVFYFRECDRHSPSDPRTAAACDPRAAPEEVKPVAMGIRRSHKRCLARNDPGSNPLHQRSASVPVLAVVSRAADCPNKPSLGSRSTSFEPSPERPQPVRRGRRVHGHWSARVNQDRQRRRRNMDLPLQLALQRQRRSRND